MARGNNGGFNKSELIRQFYEANPTAGPTELARMIEKQHGVKVSPAFVSTVLSHARSSGKSNVRKPGRPLKTVAVAALPAASAPAAPAVFSGLSLDTLMRAKQLANELGGVEQAKGALDALVQLRA